MRKAAGDNRRTGNDYTTVKKAGREEGAVGKGGEGGTEVFIGDKRQLPRQPVMR